MPAITKKIINIVVLSTFINVFNIFSVQNKQCDKKRTWKKSLFSEMSKIFCCGKRKPKVSYARKRRQIDKFLLDGQVLTLDGIDVPAHLVAKHMVPYLEKEDLSCFMCVNKMCKKVVEDNLIELPNRRFFRGRNFFCCCSSKSSIDDERILKECLSLIEAKRGEIMGVKVEGANGVRSKKDGINFFVKTLKKKLCLFKCIFGFPEVYRFFLFPLCFLLIDFFVLDWFFVHFFKKPPYPYDLFSHLAGVFAFFWVLPYLVISCNYDKFAQSIESQDKILNMMVIILSLVGIYLYALLRSFLPFFGCMCISKKVWKDQNVIQDLEKRLQEIFQGQKGADEDEGELDDE